MRDFAPRIYPAPGLQPGLHRKTAFCVSASSLYSGLTGQYPPVFLLYRALHLTAADTLTPGASRPVTLRHTHPFYRPHNLLPSRSLHSGLAGQQSHASHLSLQSKSQSSGSQRHSIFANPCRQKSKPIHKNNNKKNNKKKEAEASLEKITARTYRLQLHNALQSRSSYWYIPHTKTRPAVYTFWQNISFRQNVLKICRPHSSL